LDAHDRNHLSHGITKVCLCLSTFELDAEDVIE
jgi:hypothetical protein